MELRMQEQELNEVEEDEEIIENGDDSILDKMEIEEDLAQPPPLLTVDLSKFTSLLQKLESSSGLKFLKTLLQNFKEFTKLLTILPSLSVESQQLLAKIKKVCRKSYDDEEKRAKFIRKLNGDFSVFSCEEEVFKTFLKAGMKHPLNKDSGWILVSVLEQLFKIPGIEGVISSPILGIQMILSHSKAEDIFLEFHKLKVNQPRNKKLEQEEAVENQQRERPKKLQIVEKLVHSNLKTELLKLWRVLVEGFTKISKVAGTEGDKKILENSVSYLMQMYGATLGSSDRQIFSILKLYSGKKLRIPLESMPLFGPKCFDPAATKSNPLYAHSIRANNILASINETKAFETGLKFDQDVFLDEEELEKISEQKKELDLEQFYDLRFMIPLVCHILDEKNICDVVKVITNGWIHFIARGLSLTDSSLRNSSFLAFKRLIFNLHLAKGFRLQDVKIWLHFLLGVKNGFIDLKECKLTSLLSTWMVATCEVLKQPSDPLYSKVTHFLLAKPTIDLTILPDFTHFFNAEDGTKESREWILNILLLGLQAKSDWTVAKKVPTIKYMCCLFPFEKIQTQRTILKILANGAKIPEVAHDMVDRHGLLLWIANSKIDDRTYYRRELEDIYKNLSIACPQGEYRDYAFQFVAKRHKWNYIRGDTNIKLEQLLDGEQELENINEGQNLMPMCFDLI